jgi:hypothetical protein
MGGARVYPGPCIRADGCAGARVRVRARVCACVRARARSIQNKFETTKILTIFFSYRIIRKSYGRHIQKIFDMAKFRPFLCKITEPGTRYPLICILRRFKRLLNNCRYVTLGYAEKIH